MATARSELSERQTRIIGFIREFQRDRGYPPTVREIGRAADISSTSVVDYNLKVLRKLGFLRRDADVSRGIGLLAQDDDEVVFDDRLNANVVRVPVIGSIAAGQPIEAYTVPDELLELSRELADDSCFALRVHGKSMIDDLIDDGDVVVVKRQDTAENGTICVALILDSPGGEGQATLKRVYREKDRVRLQPANSAMEPIFVRPDELAIQGRVTAVIRRL